MRPSPRPLLGLVAVAVLLTGPGVKNAPGPEDTRGRAGVSGGAGFDTCSAPSLANLQAWYHVAPYRDVGIYIGGENRACSQENLNAGWVDDVVATGYGLIPIWVGLQAPCSTLQVAKMDADPNVAHVQGRAAADDAAGAAAALDLRPGSIVYDDMESYGGEPGSCRDAVDAFVDGWAAEMKAGGYLSGVYGSTCGSAVSDWAGSKHVPSDVWGANWNGQSTAWNLSCLDNSLWNGHRDRRVHQFSGNVTRTFNGVTMNVDEDCENGHVAGTRHSDGPDEDESLGGEIEDPSCTYFVGHTAAPASPPRVRTLSPVMGSYPDGTGSPSTSFVTRDRGWATVEPAHGSNFATSDLYRTADGGAHWSKMGTEPFTGPIVFTSTRVGWAAGAPGNDRLFVTRDGGWTWRPQPLPGPVTGAAAPVTVGLPTWVDERDGAVAMWFPTRRGGTAVVAHTADGGRSWRTGPSLDLPALSRYGRGTTLPFAMRSAGRWALTVAGTTWTGTAHGWAPAGSSRPAKSPPYAFPSASRLPL